MSVYSGQAAMFCERAIEEPFWEGWRKLFTRQPDKLLSFTAVQEILQLQLGQDKGIQEIAIGDIVGSVGRFNEFGRTFKPKHEFTKERLRRVADTFYRRGFDPIEVFKVSNVYFVVDGNHRVSVSRALNIKTIKARVYEFETQIALNQNDDLESIVTKGQAAFHVP